LDALTFELSGTGYRLRVKLSPWSQMRKGQHTTLYHFEAVWEAAVPQ
jgi:hypothetical protein